MRARAVFVAATAALALPLLGGTAHASCLDDVNNDISDGFYWDPKSPYWNLGYVQYGGLATVTVQGDALVSDYTSYATADVPRWVDTHSGNAVPVTLEFVDCVAG